MKGYGQSNQIVGRILNLCEYYLKLILTTMYRRKALKPTIKRVVCDQSPKKQEGSIVKIKKTTTNRETTNILEFYSG